MSIIQVSNLSFTYDGSYEPIFENLSFTIHTDWRLGFIGRNGRGKTTFLRLLQGELVYQGHIASPVGFRYFPAPVEDQSALTEDVLNSIAPGCEAWQLRRELSLLGMEPDDVLYRPYDTLSHGERTKAQLAALFLREDELLLIDEPTNHLDAEGREQLAAYLAAKPGFILVSHDRRFLDGCVDHILSINKTGMQVMQGNFSSWQREKARQDAREQAENEKRSAEIKRLSAAARRTAGWSDQIEAGKIGEGAPDRGYIGHQAAKMMKRAKSIERRRQDEIEEKSKLLKDIEYASELLLRPKAHYAQRLVTIEDAALQYGNRQVFAGLRMDVLQGQRIAITGRNGSGKSSLLKLITGEAQPGAGTVQLASGLILSVVPQDTSFLQGDLSAFAREAQIDETLFKTILRKLDFRRAQFETDMRDYSAGQRKKVLLAKSLCEQAHLYIWDEPLNFVDVLSRMQIEDLIVRCQPTMLLVEHDAAFLEAVVTDRVQLGSFSSYSPSHLR